MSSPLRVLVALVVTLVVLVAAVVAWSYWTAAGTGVADGAVATLAAPASVTATATAGSAAVPVGWSAVTGPAGATLDGYYVERRAGATTVAACASSPAALLPATSTECVDANVPDGTFTYSVTAVFRSWTAESAPSDPVTVIAVDRFSLSAPATATAGTPFTVTVTALDASGGTIAGYAGTVRFTSSDPGAPTLPADYTFTPGDAGTHTFANGVTLTTAANQTVGVHDTVVPAATGSASVTVSAGAASHLAFTRQPGGGTGGKTWATQPRVAVEDAFGNAVTSTAASVRLTISAGTGTGGAVLTCSANPKATSAGVATFSGCRIDKAGAGYTLTATASGLVSATSSPFTVAVGPATKLVYSQQPTAVVAGSAISPAVVATIRDAGSNVVTASSATVTVAIGTNPGGGTLSGTVSVAATGGVATFANLSINKAGSGYKLVASSAGLTSATSSSFTVSAGAATELIFTQQPGGGAAGTAWSTQPRVAIRDAFGNTVTSSVVPVTLAITAGSGASGAVLTCSANPRNASAGIATFSGCRIDDAASDYTLTATAAGLAPAISDAFVMT